MPTKGRKRPRDILILLWLLSLVLGAILPFCSVLPAYADSVGYKILSTSEVDTSKTTAAVDTVLHEIRLPKNAPKVAAFWNDEYFDYIVMTPGGVTHYSFDGSRMVENIILSVSGVSNPLSAHTSGEYPDVIIADGNGVTHYSFTGTEMAANPALSVAGLTGVVSVGSRDVDLAALAGDEVKYYAFDGSGMIPVPALSKKLTNPIDFALLPDSYDMIIIDGNQARYYNSGTEENPALNITGLESPKAIAAADGSNIAIVEGNQVKHYMLTGSDFTYYSAMSVTDGLSAPTCVALRPGSFDRLIVDGNDVKYYMWDGAGMVYNSQLSVTIAGLQDNLAYSPKAVAQSSIVSLTKNVSYVRVRAYHELPAGNSVAWSVTADGTNWVKKWRVRGLEGGATVCEVSPDNGSSWDPIGDESKAWPPGNTTDLWVKVTPGRSVKWKAELATSNPQVTPRIKAPNPGTDVAVLVDYGNPPQKPVIPGQDSCYLTTTPTFTWSFNDPDPGDTQSGYEVRITKPDGTPVYESGTALSSSSSFRMPTSTDPALPGPLWVSGDYQFKIRVRVFDTMGIPSEWSEPTDFCVIAFERPRVREIVSCPSSQVKPNPDDPTTQILVTEGMIADQLPKTRAGGKVGVLVDSVGLVDSASAVFPYLSTTATVGTPPTSIAVNGMNKQWQVEFWTDASLDVCPSGTVVGAKFAGGGTNLNLPPHAAGIVLSEGSVYSDWFVVLQGRK